MMEHFRFAYPQFFFFATLAAWAWWVVRKKPQALTHPGAGILAKLTDRKPLLLARLPLVLRTAALSLLILAMARPQTFNVSREVKSPGVDMILCLDTSGSMLGMDFTLNGRPVDRLTAVKKVVTDFIKKRPNDRMGIVVFGTKAFTQAPLTLDKGLLLSLVSRLTVGMAGDTTALGDALAVSGKRIKEIPAPTKVVILLTDGRQNAGEVEALEAAKALSSLGIKVYAIGVGTNGPVPFTVRGIFGDQVVHRNVEMDEEVLKEIAAATGGKYFLASDTKKLEEIYNEIDRLEKYEVKVKEFFHFKERYLPFLMAALALLLLEGLLSGWRALP